MQARLDGPASPPGRVNGPARDLALAMNAAVLRHGVPQDAGAGGIDAWSRLEEVAVPTTVACGDLDVPALLGQTELVLQRIPGARWADLTGTAHLPYLEHPELVAAITAAVRATAKALGGRAPIGPQSVPAGDPLLTPGDGGHLLPAPAAASDAGRSPLLVGHYIFRLVLPSMKGISTSSKPAGFSS